MCKNALIIFMKAPILGHVKTRLAKHFGTHNATTLYQMMCEQLLQLRLNNTIDVFVAYDGDNTSPLPTYLEKRSLFYQKGADLGERMHHAFESIFAQGYERVVLIGSDIPSINETILEEAFLGLASHDAILSPTHDGGYYLIGFEASHFCKEAFVNITYSQSDVFEKTRSCMAHLKIATGVMLYDIDTLEDLRAFLATAQNSPLVDFAKKALFGLPLISVIIPVYHEDETLLNTIAHLRQMSHASCYEIIVVDTHEKTTLERLTLEGVRLAYANKGRANQMNEGAHHARGTFLLFLHADTRLPYHWDRLLQTALNKHNAGAFRLGIDTNHLGLKMIQTLANVRTRLTRIPYGDQAHFFRTSFFHALGGYAPIPLMEDVEMMQRIKKSGLRIALLKHRVLTSARRWHKEGILYTTCRNRILSALYCLGVSPRTLSHHYKPHRSKGKQ